MKKVLFIFTFLFCFFLFNIDGEAKYDDVLGVSTNWIKDTKHAYYESCLSDNDRKFNYTYYKIDNIMKKLDEYYNNYFIVSHGACDTSIDIIIIHDNSKDIFTLFYYTYETTYPNFLVSAPGTADYNFKKITIEFSELDNFDINSISSIAWNSAVFPYQFNAFNMYKSDTDLFYYSSFDLTVTGKNTSGSKFYKDGITYDFTKGVTLIPSVYNQLHPKVGMKFKSLPVLDEEDIVKAIDVQMYPNIVDDDFYYYMFSQDGKNWTSFQLGDKSFHTTTFNENGTLYFKIIDKYDLEADYNYTYSVKGIGLNKTDYEDKHGIITDYGEGSSGSGDSDENILKKFLSKAVDFLFPYFAWVKQIPDIIKVWDYDEKVDGDCFYIDSDGNRHNHACIPLTNLSFDFSFLPFGVGDKISSVNFGREFIMWFDKYRNTVIFWERLFMVSCLILVFLRSGRGFDYHYSNEKAKEGGK